MSNGKGLSILALLIGISGLGLGIYTFVFPQVPDTNFGIQNTWFNYDATVYNTNPPATTINLNALTINFTVNSGESVYFLFSAWAGVFGAGLTSIQIRFILDGVIRGPPTYPEAIFASNGVDQYGSIALQTSNTISTGFHNVTISIIGSYATNGISQNTLLVQTYIP